MRMLKLLRLAVFVVCIAAFASGCGGGGGSTTMPEPEPPAMPEPTEPTDAEKIAAARQEVASILANAQARAQAARSAAAAIGTDADATPDQITEATSHNNSAQSALALIVSANTAATLATTPAQANTALANARAAQSTLNASASAISNIQGAVQAAANQRRQREADEAAQTGGSSLIKHLRDNKKVSDAVLGSLAAASLLVGSTTANASSATYPFHKGDTPTQYPIPRNTDRGVLGVTVSVNNTPVSSNSQMDKISGSGGSGRLSNAFDLKDGNGRFATVYTDIEVAKRERAKNQAGDDAADNDDTTDDIDERYQYVADDDYLLAGIWLDDATAGTSILRAFAFGSQPLAADHNFCTAADVDNSDTLTRNCGNATGKPFNTIAGFVDENESTEATYRGGVNGAYFAGGKASHFKANVSLTATFVRGTGTDATGSKISGKITTIMAGGNSIEGSIDLKEVALTNDISGPFNGTTGGEAAGVIEGHAYTGSWKGQFFGMRARKLSPVTTGTVAGGDRTTTTTYTPDKPDSVAGSFYVNRQTVGEGDAAFIGSFGAHR